MGLGRIDLNSSDCLLSVFWQGDLSLKSILISLCPSVPNDNTITTVQNEKESSFHSAMSKSLILSPSNFDFLQFFVPAFLTVLIGSIFGYSEL